MKIEKVNERQIRCTLTGDDLANRQLKISELAYGSEKAKNLFRDMMRQAEYECGFEAEDIPLVIEAIPVNADCIILIITKVEDPEELDTRFSKFAPAVSDSERSESSDLPFLPNDFAEEMINMLKEVKGSLARQQAQIDKSNTEEGDNTKKLIACLLQCDNISILGSFARAVNGFYHEDSSLYRKKDGTYALLFTPGKLQPKEYARICNIASEFGKLDTVPDSRLSYMEEHYNLVIPEDAVSALSNI